MFSIVLEYLVLTFNAFFSPTRCIRQLGLTQSIHDTHSGGMGLKIIVTKYQNLELYFVKSFFQNKIRTNTNSLNTYYLWVNYNFLSKLIWQREECPPKSAQKRIILYYIRMVPHYDIVLSILVAIYHIWRQEILIWWQTIVKKWISIHG